MKHIFMRIFSMIMMACLFFAMLPVSSGAEQNVGADAALMPTLYIRAEYSEGTMDGKISAGFRLECRSPESALSTMTGAPSVSLSFEGKNGLVVENNGVTSEYIGYLACGSTYRFDLTLRYDETLAKERNEVGEIEPQLIIEAFSPEIGGCSYSCVFDITPEANAVLLGVNSSPYLLDSYLMQNTLKLQENTFAHLYYDQKNINVKSVLIDASDPNAANVLTSLSDLSNADENDVSYVYLNAFSAVENGKPVAGVEAPENGNTRTVYYNEVIKWLKENVKGRIILLADSRYGSLAVSVSEVSGLDRDYVNIIGVNVPAGDQHEPEHGSPYQGGLARSMTDMNGTYTVSSFMNEIMNGQSDVNQFLTAATGKQMSGFYSGNGGNPMFSTDPEYDSGIRILTVKEEKCIVSPLNLDPVHMYYQYLRTRRELGEGLASDEAIPVKWKRDESHWEEIGQKGGNGFLSAIVCDLDQNGTQDMLCVYSTYDYADPSGYDDDHYYNAEPEHFGIELRLYQIDNGEVYLADTYRHAMYFDNFQNDSFGRGYVYLQKADGYINIFCDSWFVASNSHNGSHGGTYHVENGKIVSGGQPARFEHAWTERTQNAHASTVYQSIHGSSKSSAFIEYVREDMPYWICATYYSDPNYRTFDKSIYYRAWDFTNLRMILDGEAPEEYYEIYTLADYVAPPTNLESERYGDAISDVFRDIFPDSEISIEFRDDAHQTMKIYAGDTVYATINCNEEGKPTKVDVRSRSGTKEWQDEFQAIYEAVVQLPETGLSQEEIDSLKDKTLKVYDFTYSASKKVRAQFTYEPMNHDYAILMIYFDLS